MRRRLSFVLIGWLLLLAISHLVRWRSPEPPPQISPPDAQMQTTEQVRLVYRDQGPRDAPAVLLLHGSPGSRHDFDALTPELAVDYRTLAVDLPGFGLSSRDVDDYSIRAHAEYALELLDELGIERAHMVGFSMGGGVALEIYDQAPQRVSSLTLLSAIGVQELELFGDYRMNHIVHGFQLGAVRFVEEGVPHFGALDGLFFGKPYARNFYDTDQRPLRRILERFEPPLLIVHGEGDPLVPAAAALEHERIVPHATLDMTSSDHFMIFRRGSGLGAKLATFLSSVERGEAARRADASPQRVDAAARPFDPASIPPPHGIALVLILVSIALATLVSEDLTCIFVGLLVGQGRLPFAAAVIACCVGIFIGDMLLFLAGRWLGRPALRRPPLRWMLRESLVEQSSRWFNRRGPIVIAISRFVPGMRLPTYFAAGLLRTSMLAFAFYFALAVAVWTPLLVGVSAFVGERAFHYFDALERHIVPALLLLGVWILIVVKLLVPAFSWRGRRLLLGSWRRWTRWEFWPPWLFYPPVLLYVLWLGIRYRSFLLFTATNPAIEASGFIAESKFQILEGLNDVDGFVARYTLLPGTESVEARMRRIDQFFERFQLDYPVVLKPDAGQRGSGVAVIRSSDEAERYLEGAPYDLVAQEFAPGDEFGVFYIRQPGEQQGKIFSITEKRMPEIVGDGASTIERLILSDDRAVAVADHYLERYAGRLEEIPAVGERHALVELGTHCRGAIFLDGIERLTPELERRIDLISKRYDGFYFGRYDIRAADLDRFAAGEAFKILELNGVTSEATHIYDPKHRLTDGWRTLCEQWRIAFEIGKKNRDSGHPPVRFGQLVRLMLDYRRSSSHHPD
jgi:pimeloyl-ACP methyl ester carboxylesterase/membrane protein DedA with SNARE-associated domain